MNICQIFGHYIDLDWQVYTYDDMDIFIEN